MNLKDHKILNVRLANAVFAAPHRNGVFEFRLGLHVILKNVMNFSRDAWHRKYQLKLNFDLTEVE